MGRKLLLCGQDVYDSQVMAFLGSIQLHFIPSWNALGITCVFPISNTYHGDQDSALGWLLPWGEQVTVIDSRPDFVQSDLNTLSQIWQPWLDILHCQKKTQCLDFVVIQRENQERAMVPTCMIWIPESQPVLGVTDQFKKNLRVPLAPSIIEMNFRRRKSDSLPTPPQDWFPSDPPDKFLMPSLFAPPLRPVTNLKVGEEQASKPTASVSQLDTKLAKTKRPTRKTKSTISSPTKVRLKYEHEEVTEDDFQFFDANGNGCMAAPQIRKLIPNDTLPAEFRPLKDIRLDWGHYKEGGLYNYEPRTESLVDKTEPPAVSVETRIPTWQKFEPAGVMDIDESTDTFEANEHDNATEQQLQTKNKQVTDLKDDDKSSQFEHVVFQGPHDLICVDPGDLRSEHPSTGSSEASTSFNWYRLQLIHKSLNQCRLKLAHRTLYQILRSQLKMQLKLFSLSDKTCEILDAPQAIVLNQRRHELYAEIAALNHWQELGFFPWAGPKNVAAISFQFKNNDSVDSMFRQLGMVYSALNLGSYRLKKIHLDIEIGERILRNPNVMIKSLLNRYDETRSLLNLDADTHLIVFIVDPLGEKVGATFWPDVIEGFRQRLNMQYLPVFLLKQSDCTVRNILDCKTAMKLYSSIDMHAIKPLRVDLFPELQGVVKEKYVSAPLWILKDRYPTSPVIFTQETRIASVFIHSSKIDGSLVVEILETSGRFRKTLVVSQNEPNPILFLYRYLRKYLPSCYQWEIIWVLNRPLNDGASIIIPWQTESKNTHAKHITPRQSLLIRPKSCILDYCTYEKSSPPSKNWKAFVTSDRNEFPLTVSLSPVAYGVLVLESSNIYEEVCLFIFRDAFN